MFKPLLAFTLLAVMPVIATAQIALVHVTQCGAGVFPATTCTIPATGSGNLILVAWSSSWGSVPTIASITDNAGNSYVEAGNARSVDSSNDMMDFWYAKNSIAGSTVLTVTPNTPSSGGAVIWEFSGLDPVSPLDQASVLNSQPASATPSGASVTITAPSEVVVSTLAPAGSMGGLASGSPFTSDASFFGVGWAHLVTTSTGTYAPVWNTSSGTYASSTVSFKAKTVAVSSACDLNQDGTVNVVDVQLATNMYLGMTPCTANIDGSGVCNTIVVHQVETAALGGACVTAGSHTVTLNWTASTTSGVNYNVYRSATSGGPYTKLTTSAPIGAITYTDGTVVAGLTYYYVTTAINTAGESGYSNEATALIPFP